jgi:diadenosine tetraphosphate (Ap4A) HIT family hydrolase
MSKDLQEFNVKFRVDELILSSSKYWNWSVRPSQCTIGAGILSLKRYADSFSQISLDESQDLKRITHTIESTLKSTFNYDKINYLMLMMVDSHLHFHIVPRYEKSVTFSGKCWTDNGWPGVPALTGETPENSLLYEIRDSIKKGIST